jgi:hypothetical protein
METWYIVWHSRHVTQKLQNICLVQQKQLNAEVWAETTVNGVAKPSIDVDWGTYMYVGQQLVLFFETTFLH